MHILMIFKVSGVKLPARGPLLAYEACTLVLTLDNQ